MIRGQKRGRVVSKTEKAYKSVVVDILLLESEIPEI